MGEEKKNNDHENDNDRPSSARRKQLREADAAPGSVPMVSNFFPLERYYEASDKVLQSFETAYEAKRLDEAFVYGMRYCTFYVEGISKHDYYMSAKFAARRNQTNQRVAAILTKLEQVAEWMDQEEIEKEAKRRAILKRQQEERLRKQRALEQQRIEELERRIAKQKEQDEYDATKKVPIENVEESAMAKLMRLSQPLQPPPSATTTTTTTTTATVPKKRVSFQIDDRQREPDGHSFSTLNVSDIPPPLLPPPLPDEAGSNDDLAPPDYHSIMNHSNYFGPGAAVLPPPITPPPTPLPPPTLPTTTNNKPQPLLPPLPPEQQEPAAPPYDLVIKQKPPPPKTIIQPPTRLNIRQYIAQASRLNREYQQQRKIQVSALKTYQGRVSGSTNGCTVISACVVSKHLQTHGGVTDAQIVNIIDNECVPLLRAIRNKLGLGGGSLIIPSDVHDHMVDHNLLFQHKFVGAAGGNIVDPEHFGELLTLLQGEAGKTQHLKAGATLFFREHVISIVKFPTSPTQAVYDMVDSLPTVNGRASRTRCTSLEALKVQLEWYTSHKFSDSNVTYMERNSWDDAMADFDPRVFQAFVWADLPKPKS